MGEENLLDVITVYSIMKIGMLACFAFYVVFAFVIAKQVNRMTQTLEVGFELPLKIFAWLHLLLSIGVLLLGLVIL